MRQTLEMSATALGQLNKAFALNTYLFNQGVTAGLLPAMRYTFDIEHDVVESVLAAVGGRKRARACAREIYDRARSGARYDRLVRRFGRALFGTATFAGERVLADTDLLRLSYLPPDPEVAPAGVSLFHVGGFLPYSDRIFRILPEANLFRAFLKRGIQVYAMELRADRCTPQNLRSATLERFIDAVDRMSDVAFDHPANRGRKMIAEGYCGLGMPTLAYLAARPERADIKFRIAATMVAPIDASRCSLLGEVLRMTPDPVLGLQRSLAALLGGVVRGQDLGSGMDIPLGVFVHKSPLGRFAAGWGNPVYAHLASVDELDPRQRREMAGAYWISPANAKRCPLPVDLVRFFTALFREGIGDDLTIPATYRGRRLSLRTIVERTGIDLVGFYGARDPVVPDTTAQVLARVMGPRYTHVVHDRAGHISYVLSPEQWNPRCPGAFDPNPIDAMLGAYRNSSASSTHMGTL